VAGPSAVLAVRSGFPSLGMPVMPLGTVVSLRRGVSLRRVVSLVRGSMVRRRRRPLRPHPLGPEAVDQAVELLDDPVEPAQRVTCLRTACRWRVVRGAGGMEASGHGSRQRHEGGHEQPPRAGRPRPNTTVTAAAVTDAAVAGVGVADAVIHGWIGVGWHRMVSGCGRSPDVWLHGHPDGGRPPHGVRTRV
jgi:hypothetical protein